MKKALIGCFLLVLLLVGAGALYVSSLDKQFHVERRVTIDAPPAAVFPHVANLRSWPDWTVWNTERDPSAEWTYTGEDGTVGAVSEWRGASSADGGLGHGKMVTTELVPDRKMVFDLVFFEEDAEYVSVGGVHLEPTAGGTEVRWTMDGEIDMFLGGLVALMMDSSIGADFEAGLQGLKELSESSASAGSAGASEAATDGQDG